MEEDINKKDIAIIGTMGSGKTTVGKMLADKLEYRFFPESFDACPTLVNFYRNPVKYALDTELWFLVEKGRQHIEIGKYPGSSIQDSPIQSSIGVFARAMLNRGILKSREYLLLNDIYYEFMEGVIPRPDYFIYLDVSVDVLMERVTKRGREFEKTVDVDYLQSSITAAKSLVAMCKNQKGTLINPVVVVDGNNSPDKIVDEIIEKLQEML